MQQRLAPFVADPRERLDLLTQIHQQATQLNLPPELVLSVIEVESGFDRYALSKAGAQGLMQVMPFWKNEIGRPDDNLIHMPTNLRYGCHILRFYLDREDQNLKRALPPTTVPAASCATPTRCGHPEETAGVTRLSAGERMPTRLNLPSRQRIPRCTQTLTHC